MTHQPEAAQAATPTSAKEILKRSAGYFKPHKFIITIACIAMLITGLSSAGIAWLVKPALDDIFINGDRQALFWVPIAFVVLTLVKGGTRLAQNYLMQIASLKVLEVLRDELYRKVIMLPLRFFEHSQVGVLMSRIINDVAAVRVSMPTIVLMLRQVISAASLLVVVFYQDFRLAMWAIIGLPLAFFPFVYFARRLRKLGRKSQEQTADITALLQESLSGVRVVKAFCTEDEEAKRFDKNNKRLLTLNRKECLANESSSAVMELVGALGVAVVIWVGGMQVIEGKTTPGTFFSFVTALIMMYEPVKKFTGANNALQRALAGAERIFGLLDDPRLTVEQGGNMELDTPFQSLAFQNVSLTYADGTQALKDISFTVQAGERIAIVGPSGAGKTTCVNLIPRFYDPSEGRILVNGLPVQEYTLPSLRHAVSLVSQDNFLFNLTVEENIAYGIANVNREAVIEAAKAAYAHDFIEALPQGYDTVIGERGVKLSGGQRQRLTIARALVKDAPLLILDEATSALDSESERTVQKALDNLMEERTSIVIAHRLSTIINATRIMVMEGGRVAAMGTHQELLASSPLYAKLYTMQYQSNGEGA
ncbi:ABC transporter ATP-binding protein [Desulfovibrio cuneatus]|uniref:ABC transporter ATP-binding protein n=1 Tax=Desulfovibrio cuneatus TaxID=159728 RepID=UPI00040DF664|nr:ABC transporter transmembrane domain-containing protein [Desulfovibrio cuneatus]